MTRSSRSRLTAAVALFTTLALISPVAAQDPPTPPAPDTPQTPAAPATPADRPGTPAPGTPRPYDRVITKEARSDDGVPKRSLSFAPPQAARRTRDEERAALMKRLVFMRGAKH